MVDVILDSVDLGKLDTPEEIIQGAAVALNALHGQVIFNKGNCRISTPGEKLSEVPVVSVPIKEGIFKDDLVDLNLTLCQKKRSFSFGMGMQFQGFDGGFVSIIHG